MPREVTPAAVEAAETVTNPVVPQQSWLQRNQGGLALGGLGLAGVLGGGTLAYYRNQQEKKKRKNPDNLNDQQGDTQPAKEAGVKRAKYSFDQEDCPKCKVAMEGDPDSGCCNSCGHTWGEKVSSALFAKRADPLPDFKTLEPSSWKLGDRLGGGVQELGNRFGSGINQSGVNPVSGFGDYVSKNPWASMALIGAPVGAGIGLLGGLTNRKKKRDSLGDMLTGGLLGAGAGALGGGAVQMLQGNKTEAPPPPTAPPGLKGVTGSPAFGGGDAKDPQNRLKEFILGNNDSAQQGKSLEDANKLYGLAGRADPKHPAFQGLAGAADNRLSAQQTVQKAEEGAPTLLDRVGLGKEVTPDYAQKIEQARQSAQQSNAVLGEAARRIPPSAFLSGPSADQVAGPFKGFGPAVSTAAGAGSGMASFVNLDKGLQEKGMIPWPRANDTILGRAAARTAGKTHNPYLGAEALGEKVVADPGKFDEFNDSQVVKDTPALGKGSLGANTLQNAAGIGAGRLGLTQLNRARTGNTQNQADAARMAQGLEAHMSAPKTPVVKPGEGRSLLNPLKWVDAAKDITGRASGALGLSTKPVTPQQFTGNPGAMAALTSTAATGASGAAPTAAQIAKEIQSGKPSQNVQNALGDLIRGRREVNGAQIPVGRRDVDLNQFPNMTQGQKATLGAPDGMFGPGTKATSGFGTPNPSSAKLPAVNDMRGRLGGQLRATGQNLGLGAVLAGGDKLVRGGQDARSLGASLAGRENDPTDPQNIRKLYETLKAPGAAAGAVPKAAPALAGRPSDPGEAKTFGELLRGKQNPAPPAEPTFNDKGEETVTAGEHVRRLLGISKPKSGPKKAE